MRATAVRALRPPVIDGRDDDEVWAQAPAIMDFREWQPVEDGNPRFRTVAKIAYDDRNLYAFVRAYDPHPDSILKPLSRRDVFGPSDRVWVMIDSYHDRRSGYEFGVTAAGVKIDIAISNDGNEDMAWDGVWYVATAIDSLGWTAEYRIPLSQVRYPRASTHTFGIMILRDLYRYTERLSWPVLRQSRSGFVSQFGEVTGLDGLASPRRLEVAPYVVTKNVSVPTAGGFGRNQNVTAGANIKYGITSNLTLDGTVNPDFGQVEADPAVLNLSAFETFFQERRPFFVEGAGIFRFDVDCSAVNCNGEGLFYSRRIGRGPQLGRRYGTPSSATATTILGATKLTGRLPSGLSVGVLEALTQRAVGRADTTIEPRT
ncbi:MAG: hydrolase, partial [Gemmatimonadetes bacterium]